MFLALGAMQIGIVAMRLLVWLVNGELAMAMKHMAVTGWWAVVPLAILAVTGPVFVVTAARNLRRGRGR
jgi:hypothetical protein